MKKSRPEQGFQITTGVHLQGSLRYGSRRLANLILFYFVHHTRSAYNSGTCLCYPAVKSLPPLALPILGGQLAQTANGFVDTMMAGRVGANDLAAVAVGASIWVPLFLFMTGVLMSATPILSRHLGGKAYHRINPLAQQGLWLALVLGVLCALILRSIAPLLVWMDVDPAIRPMVSGYLDALSWGMPGAAIMLALRSYTEAMNHTRPVLLISVIGLMINIPSNYVLIYGKLGFPAMGGVGCGWATTGNVVHGNMMMVYTHRHPVYQHAPLNLRQRHFERANLSLHAAAGLTRRPVNFL